MIVNQQFIEIDPLFLDAFSFTNANVFLVLFNFDSSLIDNTWLETISRQKASGPCFTITGKGCRRKFYAVDFLGSFSMVCDMVSIQLCCLVKMKVC